MFQATIKREFSQNRDQTSGIDFLKHKLVGGRSKWAITSKIDCPDISEDGKYVYICTMNFEKKHGQRSEELIKREWTGMLENLAKFGSLGNFATYPWVIIDPPNFAETSSDSQGVHHALSKNTGITLADVKERVMPTVNELLNSEEALDNSEYFKGIFGRNAQLRTILSSIKSFLESDGQRRNHIILWGSPGCCKSHILSSVGRLLGHDAVVRLDGTSTTPAGIYKVYFQEFDNIPEPPFVILEEAEKTSEDSLRVWLGALDDRGELRKINAREMRNREIKILCLATANDKDEFDRLMGGTLKRPGALSSRFVHQLECPRPNRHVLKMILTRDIDAYGGNHAWIEPALDLASEVGTDDPRKVLGYLDGGDRLLTGEYQKDIHSILGIKDLEVVAA